MEDSNLSCFQPATVQLTGFPDLERFHPWLSIPLCALYVTAIAGNGTIVFLIRRDRRLHQPMHLFLGMLSLNDLGVSLSPLPPVLPLLCFGLREVVFAACLAQMFFIHTFLFMESGILLLAMSFDRLVAICTPLRYASTLTSPRMACIGLAVVLKSTLIMLPPFPFLTLRLPVCQSNVLSHAHCLHPDMMRLACADITVSNVYGFFAVLATYGLDSAFILLSYAAILRTALSTASREQRRKALDTCVSPVCAVLAFYVPIVAVSVLHRLGKKAPPLAHTLLSNADLFVPPLLNPVIYSIKTKGIRKGIRRMLA